MTSQAIREPKHCFSNAVEIENTINVGSKFDPDEDACDGDHGSEGRVKFFVSSDDASVMFEVREEALDSVAFTIEMLVNDGLLAYIGQNRIVPPVMTKPKG